jgi:putative transposase
MNAGPAHRIYRCERTGERWVESFVGWHNGVHRHSTIRYVTPNERHQGRGRDILGRRHEFYRLAGRSNSGRWTSNTRNGNPVDRVVLNPGKVAAES